MVHASSTVTDAVDTAAALPADSEFVTRNGDNDGMAVVEEGTMAQTSSASEVPHSISAISMAVEFVMVLM